jgi:hypothetical protein
MSKYQLRRSHRIREQINGQQTKKQHPILVDRLHCKTYLGQMMNELEQWCSLPIPVLDIVIDYARPILVRRCVRYKPQLVSPNNLPITACGVWHTNPYPFFEIMSRDKCLMCRINNVGPSWIEIRFISTISTRFGDDDYITINYKGIPYDMFNQCLYHDQKGNIVLAIGDSERWIAYFLIY